MSLLPPCEMCGAEYVFVQTGQGGTGSLYRHPEPDQCRLWRPAWQMKKRWEGPVQQELTAPDPFSFMLKVTPEKQASFRNPAPHPPLDGSDNGHD